ncbi:MAG: DNA cytosine methyltransferase [Pyrinomonadaceae bacterium]
MQRSSVVDLFCGIGGLTHGFVKEGFNVVAGIDADETCKYAYEKNNSATFIKRDVEGMAAGEIIGLYPKGDTKILVGCAPCQPFSRYTIRKDEDDKWKLLRSFAKLIRDVQPEIVSMENVPELKDHLVYNEFTEALDAENYFVSTHVVYSPDYGIPQTRERLVLFASKYSEIEIIKPTHSRKHYRTVRDTIEHLEPLEAGQTSVKDPLHQARRLSELNLRRIRNTPPGGGWKDWDEELVLDCHKATTGRSYSSVYGRMKWDEPSPTMTTHCGGLGNGRFGHPEQHRAISLREAALFQTFPISYKLIQPGAKVTNKTLSRQIGNAVPVRLGRIIARTIRKHLEELHHAQQSSKI